MMVEETVNAIEFPIFNLDISEAVNGITVKFSGELTSASQKTELSTALSKAIERIYNELCEKLKSTVKSLKTDLLSIGHKVQENLLNNITEEFESLLLQCENKDKEIAGYKEYAAILEKELSAVR